MELEKMVQVVGRPHTKFLSHAFVFTRKLGIMRVYILRGCPNRTRTNSHRLVLPS
jgi:hypothetical protein